MTHEQWTKLTPEEQRMLVAELCGFKEVHRANCGEALAMSGLLGEDAVPGMLIGRPRNDSPDGSYLGNNPLPDYLNDLNDMHEAESHLSLVQHLRFEQLLYILRPVIGRISHATATQRAEAFAIVMEGA